MDSWSTKEYKTFITARRDDVFENRESSAFSFKLPSPIEVGRGDYSDKEVYFDKDVKMQWDSMVRMALRKPLNTDVEFEFKSAPVSPALASLSQQDDDVFQGPGSQLHSDHSCSSQRGDYRQHPVYRKQVELDDASRRVPTFVVSQRTVPEPFSLMSPGSLSRMYQPKYSKFCVNSTDIAPVETAMDSQSSSFRSQTSICEPGDRDTGDSSTSRDSTGSSNDASSVSTDTTFDRAFDVYEHYNRSSNATTPTLKSKVTPRAVPCPTDRRSVVSATNADHEKAAPNVNSWLRSPLKWTGIFGAKKPPKSSSVEVRTEHDHRSAARMSSNAGGDARPGRAMSRLFNPPNCDDKNLPSKPRSFLALPIQQQGPNAVDSKASQGLKLKPAFPSDFDVHSVVSTDRDRDQGAIPKIRERWLKYMRMLTPPYGKSSPKTDVGAVARGGSLPIQVSTTGHQEYVHVRAKSMPAILKTPPLRPRSNPGAVFQPSANINIPSISGRSSMMPPAGPSSAKKNSFLAHGGSLVSSSPRLMKSSSPRLMSLSPKVMKSSPKVSVNTISPRMSCSSASSMSELHSAVQGAIAHCKQSHSGLLSPAPSARRY